MELSTDALTPEKSRQLALLSYGRQQAKKDPLRVEAEQYKKQYNERVKARINLNRMKKEGPTTTVVDMTGEQEKRWKNLPSLTQKEKKKREEFHKYMMRPGSNTARKVINFHKEEKAKELARIRALAEEASRKDCDELLI